MFPLTVLMCCREENLFSAAHSVMQQSLLPPHSEGSQKKRREALQDQEDDSCDSGTATPLGITDTSKMSVEELLHVIRVPTLVPHNTDSSTLKDYLDPHEIGHLNHLIKCFTDAIISVPMPEDAVGKSNMLPIDFLDVYCCSILRIYFLLFKNLDFMNLLLADQVILMECGVLKALLCMSFFVFKEENNSWNIPSSLNEASSVMIKIHHLNQILPYNLLQQALSINILSTKLKFDWHMGMLCIGAFFYSPADVQVQQTDKVDTLRDRYMEILLKYLKWKHGSYNTSILFPEILKLMDAMLKHCGLVENLNLRLKDEEISALEKRLRTLNVDIGSNVENKVGIVENDMSSGATFSKINRKIIACVQCNLSSTLFSSGGESRDFAAVPTASMHYSNLPIETEEAKHRRKVEALLLRGMLQKTQPLLERENNNGSVEEEEVSEDIEPTVLPQGNLFAIQRLLRDLSHNDQNSVSLERAVASSSREAYDDSPQTCSTTPTSLTYQLIQQKLLDVSTQQQRTHLANFAKSFEYNQLAEVKPVVPAQSQETEAIDLSKPRKLSSSIANNSSDKLAKLPALKPLVGYTPAPDEQATSIPSSLTSQLTARHIELLLESLGKSKYTASDRG